MRTANHNTPPLCGRLVRPRRNFFPKERAMTATNPYKVHVKLGQAEFSAEGPEETIKAQLASFFDLAATTPQHFNGTSHSNGNGAIHANVNGHATAPAQDHNWHSAPTGEAANMV